MKDLSWKAKAYILGTILLSFALIAFNLYRWQVEDVWMVLALCVAASIALMLKVEGATARSHYNIALLVYAFTLILYGPAPAMIVIVFAHVVEWIWHRYPWYIQLFNIASYTIALEAADIVLYILNPGVKIVDLWGVLGILAGMAAFTLVNSLTVGIVLYLARGESFAKSGIFHFFALVLDFTTLTLGAAAALAWMITPYAVILVLIPLYLIYSTLKVPALERRSETDDKTGLFNARYFDRMLKNELNRANRFDRPLTVVMADMDLLRNINNTYGHLAGDEVLIGVARILQSSMREYDIVARVGGEEFAILIPEATPDAVFGHVEELRQTIDKTEFTVATSVAPIRVTMSFGIAGREGYNQSARDIVHNADTALYHAKLRGRNCVYIYSAGAYGGLFQASPSQPATVEAAAGVSGFYQVGAVAARPEGSRQATDIPTKPRPMAGGSEAAVSEKTRPVRPWARWQVSAYIALLAVAAGLLFYSLYTPTSLDWFGLTVFIALVILTEWFSIDIYIRDTAVSTSAAPMLAGILLYGPLAAVILGTTFAIVAFIKHKSRFSRLVFNASNQIIAGLAYTGLIMISGVPFVGWPPLGEFILSLFSAGVVYLVTTFLISFGLHLDHGVSVFDVWKEQFSWLAPYYFTMGLVAYGMVFGYQQAGLIGLLVVLGPLVMVRFSQKQYLDRTRSVVTELRENNLLLKQKAEEIDRLNEGLLLTLAKLISLRDPFVLGHTEQVSILASAIAQEMGLPDKQVDLIRKAGLLHDIGKLGIPEAILSKPTMLDHDEYRVMKDHPTLGATILESYYALRPLTAIVRHHHERFDGSGYPDGLQGQDIPLNARIIAVADAVEAMASDRPYRPAMTNDEIVEELQRCAGTQFDPMVVNAFIRLVVHRGDSFVINSARNFVETS